MNGTTMRSAGIFENTDCGDMDVLYDYTLSCVQIS